MMFVDIKGWLALLVDDGGQGYLRAKEMFGAAAKGSMKLATSTEAILGVYRELVGKYQKSLAEAAGIVESLVGMEFVDLERRETLRRTAKEVGSSGRDLEEVYFEELAKEMGCEGVVKMERGEIQ